MEPGRRVFASFLKVQEAQQRSLWLAGNHRVYSNHGTETYPQVPCSTGGHGRCRRNYPRTQFRFTKLVAPITDSEELENTQAQGVSQALLALQISPSIGTIKCIKVIVALLK